jgi:hypothetical protein
MPFRSIGLRDGLVGMKAGCGRWATGCSVCRSRRKRLPLGHNAHGGRRQGRPPHQFACLVDSRIQSYIVDAAMWLGSQPTIENVIETVRPLLGASRHIGCWPASITG